MVKKEVQRVDRAENFYPSAPLWQCTVILTGHMQAPSAERAGELFLEEIESDGIGSFYKGWVDVNPKKEDPQ